MIAPDPMARLVAALELVELELELELEEPDGAEEVDEDEFDTVEVPVPEIADAVMALLLFEQILAVVGALAEKMISAHW